MKNIICFFSQKQFGKDSAADHLVEVLGSEWKRAAFADEIKNSFCDLFDVTRDFIEEWKENPDAHPGFNMSCRGALQFIGDGFRTIKDSVWIDMALDRHKQMILSDARYINELKAVHDRGGLNILIYRPGYLNDDPNGSEAQIRPLVEWCIYSYQKSGPISYLMGRGSELNKAPNGMQYVDAFIINDGSLEEFYAKVDEIVLPRLRNKGWIN